MRGLLIVLAVLGVGLAVTNPDTERFHEWAQSEIARKAAEESRAPEPGADTLGAMIAGMLVRVLPVQRDNWIVASRFTIALPNGETCRFIGVAGQIVPTDDRCAPRR